MSVVYTAQASPEQWMVYLKQGSLTFGSAPSLDLTDTRYRSSDSLHEEINPAVLSTSDGKQWAPLSSAESFPCPSPHALKMLMESVAQQQHRPCFSMVVCASHRHAANPSAPEIPRFNPQTPCMPAMKVQNWVIIYDLEVNSLFFSKAGGGACLFPVWGSYTHFSHSTGFLSLCPMAASARRCPQSRKQYWLWLIQ